ncbi:hypothetical protein XAC3562_350038 [Xanthomonas citri pv. citri]|uniref:Uncharacterized protein n=1 Tax=Xanthomonas citri pv. citri TaxID=611301 RepID=A0A0U5FDC8_XANCI|nr:hypothetical protein XAC3562_350038 [Xanthomonas citri pv. citri]CEH65212.1 hypothetical protein XACLD7_6100002 [Xanthomonas citri pv. citri]CEH96488.1 hypothetical protein XACLH37_990020 [Xanthomonas citri pv. citri]CEJ23387.1 hypothetical protein XACE116_5050002 [Xanthomonas citri pv. citri]CEJ28450.1 hypothetical protein XACE116_5050002 [Xanthomonas citri pv. citri]
MIHPVLIVGAGGWGREVLAQMQGDPACGTQWYPVGFLDTRPQILDGLDCDRPGLLPVPPRAAQPQRLAGRLCQRAGKHHARARCPCRRLRAHRGNGLRRRRRAHR